MTRYNLISALGIAVLFFAAWLLSEDRRRVNWRVILWALGLQFAFGMVVFVFPPGAKAFLWLNGVVVHVMDSAAAGGRFVFGRLALPPGTVGDAGEESLGFFLAFQGFPTIIFFSALMAILYHIGLMPRVVRGFASVFTRLMRISGAESLCAASNIFVGVESSLTVKPHLETMTRSELMTVLTVSLATVASNVLAVYVFSLKELFPTIAAHLISASFLSAPAALALSKLMVPERGTPLTLGLDVQPHYNREPGIFEALIAGANTGVRLIVGIAALLIAVLGMVALTDLVLGGVGAWVNGVAGLGIDWSLAGLLGYAFHPIALIIGVPPADAAVVARIIGERAIVTEITAYQDLARAVADGVLTSPRSAVLCAYALCGFAHVASVAIFIGGIAAVAPKTTRILGSIGLRALVTATLACLMTACVAGVFFSDASVLFG